MAHHSDTTLSEPPLSPFSTRSLLSDGTQTSDGINSLFCDMNSASYSTAEPADLGAFTSVFRVLNQLQLQQQQSIDPPSPPRSDSRATDSNYESESEVGDTSTVWSQHPIASYLNRDDTNDSVHSRSTSNTPEAVSEEEDEEEGSESSGTEGQLEDDTEIDGVSPSLGYLDSALVFLAAEKAKLAAAHLDGRNPGNSSTGESAWRHVIEPRRRRRRRRRGASTLARMVEQDEDVAAGTRSTTVVPTPEGSSSSPDQPSLFDKDGKNELYHDAVAESPAAKRHRSRSRHRTTQSQSQQRLYIPSSAPIPIPRSLPTPPDPRLLRLRALTDKLRHDFPQNSSRLAHILVEDFPEGDVIDPRGPEPQPGDALTHVFIDHSNILIGFINLAKRSRRSPPKPLMSFAALALILERGRPISRRVLATSSPLYQNMDIAEDLGYGVHVYVRVPDFSGDTVNGSGANANNGTTAGGSALVSRGLRTRRPTTVQTASMPARPATESDPGGLGPSPPNTRSSARPYSHSRSISATTASTSTSSVSTLAPPNGSINGNGNSTASGRIRYREQGVDELLQLKLHQALVSPDADPPPAGATIVLATGDGASGQFNEDGFVGVVRTALNKGWMVELYAWVGGLSHAWRKVAEEEGRGRLRIWEMDPYVSDLLEVGGAP